MRRRVPLLTAVAVFAGVFGIAPAMRASLITYTVNGTFNATLAGSNVLQGQSFTATAQVDTTVSGTIVNNPGGVLGSSDTFTLPSTLTLSPGLFGLTSFSDPASVLTI